MEWNCCWNVNAVSPFLFESTGDSEQVKSDVHQDHEEDEAVMDESEGVLFRFDGEDDVDDDDDGDARSCSYDHSSYINTGYGDSQRHQSQRKIFDDHEEDGNIDDGDLDIDDDDMNKNWGSFKKEKRSNKLCIDSSNQREIDRKFWEACLAT